MNYRVIALVAALATASSVAAQDCPTAEDLETGIRLTRTDPLFSVVLTRTPDGISEARVMERDGVPEDVSSVYSHGLTVTRRIGAGGTLELRYDRDTTELDSLPGYREWTSPVALLSNGEVVNSGTYTVRISGLGDATIGDCTYTVWRVQDRLQMEGLQPLAFEKAFAPDLGIPLSAIQLAPDGSPVSGVFFDEIAVEPAQ
ncbi:hypothetical protein EU803_17500 [Loktanella sp. IMCC34160]|uniref:hypothetical protein n=1 Tax=Loktanella sp. IMCC34160 TaxID=2510646 RepID=UPI00101CD88B|nr:hypothetical protein [Loktanella sp. IMCC34160]RYG89525.1 hypothetical protein EU803_17500 [Loktanella sp. IMCC34160]